MSASHAVTLLALFAITHLVLGWIAFRRHRGARAVRCPMTRGRAVVRLDAMRAALLLTRPEDVKVVRCSLWPEHRNCYQWCREEVEHPNGSDGRCCAAPGGPANV
jgi:hypothetical protein